MRTRSELARVALATGVLVLGCAKQEIGPPVEPAVPTAPRGPVASNGLEREPVDVASPPDETGLASWYGNAFRGKRTSSGERFDPALFTAAHKRLPFGTVVDVTRSDTRRTVRVRINDRGPNGRAAHRIIDLSQRAAEELDIVRAGVVRVELRVVKDTSGVVGPGR